MKILITTDWYKPIINGVVTSVLNLKAGLEKMGNEVCVLTLSNTVHSYEQNGVTYIGSVSVGLVYPNARLKMALSHQYIHRLIEWNPDVIHSQCEFSTFFMARKIAQATGAPLVHTYHTIYEDYTHYFSPSRRVGKLAVAAFSRKILRHAQLVIAPTTKVKAMLEGYHIKPAVLTIPSGIDLSHYNSRLSSSERNTMREKLGILPTDTVLIYIGRLAKEKNIEELINLMKNEPDTNLRLLLVGDGPYRNTLEKESSDSRVVFAGMISADRIAAYYQLGDIFVSASNSETQGLTYIEAMASGLPLLCKQDDCLSSVIIPCTTGFLYSNANEFRNTLLALKSSMSLRDAVGAAAIKSVKGKYSTDAFAAAVFNAYSSALLAKAEAAVSIYTH